MASLVCLPKWHLDVQEMLGYSDPVHSGYGPDADGDIPNTPEAMLADASSLLGRTLSFDAYTLARTLRSEYDSGSPQEKVAIAEATINEAASHGKSVTEYAIGSAGSYGRQGSRRPVSTAMDPLLSDILIAEFVLRGKSKNFVQGANIYFDPNSQDALYNQGRVSNDAEGIARKWGNEGFAWVGALPGVDHSKLMLLRKGADPSAAVDLNIAGLDADLIAAQVCASPGWLAIVLGLLAAGGIGYGIWRYVRAKH